MKKLASLLMVLVLGTSIFGFAEAPMHKTLSAQAAAQYKGYIENADPQYAYNIAYELSTNPEFFNSDQGGRTAGSEAEHKTADYLAKEMKKIGLTNVEKIAADADVWQFNGAEFKVDGKNYNVYSYATAATPKISAELIYVGKGTMQDYENIDAKGKIVLIDIDQRNDWWITYPMLEAQHQGAVGILAANIGGFSQIAEDALNSQDICGPTSIPTLSIGVADAKELQAKIAKGKVTAELTVDNEVEIGTGTTYNVMGVLKGKSSDNQIVVGAHYDVHFWGFQDDSAAVGLALAMAKSMIDSGFKPENDIVFVLHGAEEWGSSYTQYDWTVGAWEMINNAKPEWVGKTLAFINFELPAYEFDTYTSTYSAPEMFSMLDHFANEYPYSPDPEGCFPDGVLTEGYQTYTYSDDFSYYVAGVPSTVNGFLLQKDMETVFPFYEEIYHSQYDTADTYNEAVMSFNLKYYGALALYIDRMPALYLDFTSQYDRIAASLDEEILKSAGVNLTDYSKALNTLKEKAAANKARVEKINKDYMAAVAQNNVKKAAALRIEGKALTAQNLKAFKYAQDELLSLMYERPIVPHEAPQENILLAQEIVKLLEQGKNAEAVDEYVWKMNNILEWYAMYFSPEVIDIQDDMLWGEGNKDNLYWGTNKAFVKSDVEEATRSLMASYEETNLDLSKEIAIYKADIKNQKAVLKTLADQEAKAMLGLADMLK